MAARKPKPAPVRLVIRRGPDVVYALDLSGPGTVALYAKDARPLEFSECERAWIEPIAQAIGGEVCAL